MPAGGMGTRPMLTISDARKTFHPGTPDERRALAGVDLTLNEGDFCKSRATAPLTIGVAMLVPLRVK